MQSVLSCDLLKAGKNIENTKYQKNLIEKLVVSTTKRVLV